MTMRAHRASGWIAAGFGATALSIVWPASAARGELAGYLKLFELVGCAADAKISAGGVVQTWAGGGQGPLSFHQIAPNVAPSYRRCKTQTSTMKLNGGFPISPTGKDVSMGYISGNVTTQDTENAVNKATTFVSVSQLNSTPHVEPVRQPNGAVVNMLFNNTVNVTLTGTATPGTPADGHDCHSSDSFSAADIISDAKFLYTGGNKPAFVQLVKNQIPVGSSQQFDGKVGVNDPCFVTVNDLTSGVSTTEQVMSQTLDANNATFHIDDTGIEMVIHPGDMTSFVDLQFSSAASSWVQNGYTYFARLDPTGLTAGGATPLAGWQVTSSGGETRAFYPFGADGNPYDMATISPPDSLFTAGHDYSYDSGASDGTYAILTPEPMSVTAALGLLPLVCRRSDRRRRSRNAGCIA